MKRLFASACLLLAVSSPGVGDDRERAIVIGKRQAHLLLLRRTKSFILAGDFEAASRTLGEIDDPEETAAFIKRRYLALLFFLEGRYGESLDVLEHPSFEAPSRFGQICLQKLISMAMAARMDGFKRGLDRCRRINGETSKNRELWLTSLAETFDETSGNRPHVLEELPATADDIETILVWMKFALFFGGEEGILENIEEFPPDIYDFPTFREQAALVFYRTGDFPLAERFAKSIDTPNADNILGNIALLNKDYEGAFGYFQEALEKKPNSLNALRRAVPTAWATGRAQEGEQYLALVPPGEGGAVERLVLESGFSIKLGQFERAERAIRKAKSLIGADARTPQEIHLTHSFLSLMRGDSEEFEESSSEACRGFDGLNCWFTSWRLLRQDLPTLLGRQGPIHTPAFDPESLKSGGKIMPLREEVFIDQRTIERLDGFP